LLVSLSPAWSSPAPSGWCPVIHNLLPDNQSRRKIASVDDAAFAIEHRQGQEMNTVQFPGGNDQTKVEGKLAVGAQATVEYRSNGDKKLPYESW